MVVILFPFLFRKIHFILNENENDYQDFIKVVLTFDKLYIQGVWEVGEDI